MTREGGGRRQSEPGGRGKEAGRREKVGSRDARRNARRVAPSDAGDARLPEGAPRGKIIRVGRRAGARRGRSARRDARSRLAAVRVDASRTWVPPRPKPPWNLESTMPRPRAMSCWSSEMSSSMPFQRDICTLTPLPLPSWGGVAPSWWRATRPVACERSGVGGIDDRSGSRSRRRTPRVRRALSTLSGLARDPRPRGKDFRDSPSRDRAPRTPARRAPWRRAR